MDDMIEIEIGTGNGSKAKTTWEKRVDNPDGSSVSTRVEKVSNGYIKTIVTNSKVDDKWKHDTVKSIHNENPMEEKTLVDKLADYLKDK